MSGIENVKKYFKGCLFLTLKYYFNHYGANHSNSDVDI